MTDLTPIIQAVRLAAQLCHEVQQKHIIRKEKVGREPVTIADYGSQAIICRALQMHFPDDAVMSEESGEQFISLVEGEQRREIVDLIGDTIGEPVTDDTVAEWLDHGKGRESQKEGRIWVIDPIDGTKGFLAERHYVVAVGIMDERKPTGAVIGAPAYPGDYQGGALLHAIEGAAYIRSLHGDDSDLRPVHVSKISAIRQARALESVEKSHAGLEQMARVRARAGMNPDFVEKADSQEKYSRIAAGDAELYMRLPRVGSTRPHSIWDHAPGAALVEAAGGTVTDVDGTPLDFSEGKALRNHGTVATNGLIHDQVIEAIQQILREES